jgi:hypothetical protein
VEEKKEYFFDRCRSTFETILYYYQSKGIVCLPSSVNPDVFVEELRFDQSANSLSLYYQIYHRAQGAV